MKNELHVILGTGPVGCWIARTLYEQGRPVRVVNRTGRLPALMPPNTEIVAADVSALEEAVRSCDGATVIYQAMNPPYHEWHTYFPGLQAGAVAAARATGAVLVSIENLYMYDSSTPMVEGSPIAPRSKKGALRANMAAEIMAAHRRGEIRVTALRSSDYYGPGVLGSAFGERFFKPLLAGKKGQILGSANVPHSFAYIEDVARAAATLASRPEAIGKVWIAPHAPAWTQGAMAEATAKVLERPTHFTVISPLMLRMAGLFVPGARASVEMMYEFTEPFVVNSSLCERTFGLTPTSVEEGIRRTAEWYRTLPMS